ncbi:MAG: mandelate racemase [Acidimicrobiaceae bacterium]|nr:mandelate racemase [Acidimicrobiaceae bacterium]|tara:strand:+ start:2643 stop:3797 length:1155 start_codon:yes stop_codon:yes gene_type:complete
MKITSVTPWLLLSPAAYNFGRPGEYIFVEVKTDENITGWGEVTTTHPAANRAICAILQQLDQIIVGENPLHIEKIWNKIFRRFTYMGSRGASTNAISGVDIALWDIFGKVHNEPIYNLLGGPIRENIELYTHPDPDIGPDEAKKQAKAIADSGHTAMKFDPFPGFEDEKNGYLSGKMDVRGESIGVEVTEAIREGAGPDMELLIDAHGRFDVPTSVRLANSVEHVGIHWWEEPVPVESNHALQNVRDQINIPISVGERLHTRWEFVDVLENNLTDFLMPDVTWVGGITELKKVSTMSEAYYIPISPHDASGPINVLAGAHVMMTVPNFYKLETARHRLNAYDIFMDKPLNVQNGRLLLPEEPGLGIEMNMDYLRANSHEQFRGE